MQSATAGSTESYRIIGKVFMGQLGLTETWLCQCSTLGVRGGGEGGGSPG